MKHEQCEIDLASVRRTILAVLGIAALLISPEIIAAQQFTEIDPGLPAPPRPCVVFGDYDSDGDFDVLVAGPGKRDTTCIFGKAEFRVEESLRSPRNGLDSWLNQR